MEIKKINIFNFKTIYFVGLQTVFGLFNWLIILVIINQYDLKILGKFMFILSFTYIAHMLGNFAAEDYIVSKASLLKKNSQKILLHLVIASLTINLILYFLFSTFFLVVSNEYFKYYLVLGLNNFIGFIILIESFFIGLNNPKKLFYIKISSIMLFSIIIILFQNHMSLNMLFITFILCNMFIAISYLIIIFKKISIKLIFFKLFYKKYLPIFLSTFVSFFKMRGSIIILNFFLSEMSLGLYGLITKVIDSLTLMSIAFMKIFYNKIIPFFRREKKESLLLKKNFIFTSIFINLILIAYYAQNENFSIFLPFTISNYYFVILVLYMSLIISLMKNYESFLRLLLINKNDNSTVLKATNYSTILQLILLIFLSMFFEMKGAIIALLLNSHIIMFFYIYIKKNYEY